MSAQPVEASPTRADCPECGKDVALTKAGEFRKHKCERPPALRVVPPPAVPRVIRDLYAVDAQRPRSTQRTLGVSALGGCPRAAAETILGTVETNTVDTLAAIIGTAVHEAAEKATLERNPFLAKGTDVDVRVEFPALDLTGHADAVIDGVVEDWKTKKDLSPNHTPTKQQRWQVQVYAKGVADSGRPVTGVRLVFIPRDGKGSDTVVWEDDYREDVAIEALLWLEGIREQLANDIKPAPARSASGFCKDWCRFYDPQGIGSGCAGIPDKAADVVIDDPEVCEAAAEYHVAGNMEKLAKARRDHARPALEGQHGRAGDLIVSWSDPQPKPVLDEPAVRALLAAAGIPVPVRMETASPRISVKPAPAEAGDE